MKLPQLPPWVRELASGVWVEFGGIMHRWGRVFLPAALGFSFGVWLEGRGVPLTASVLLSIMAAVTVLLMMTRKPRLPRPGDPEG